MPLRLLFLLALAVRLVLLVQYPGIHGDDSAARLAWSDRVVLAYQLPLPQLVVVVMRRLAPHPLWTQLVFVLIGSAVAPLLAAVVSRLESRLAGRVAGLVAAVQPLFVYYSLVPYQEGPMLALLLAAALALTHGRERVAAFCLGLACLCRYEAWIAAAILVVRRRTWRSAWLFGAAPLAWMLVWSGLSPRGTYVLDLDPVAGRLHRLGYLTPKVVEYAGPVLAALGAIGAAWALKRGDRRWRPAAAFLAAFVAAVVVAGHEFPPGSGRVSERLAHLPVLALCAGASVVLARTMARSWWAAALGTGVLALVCVDGARRACGLVEAARRSPSLQLARAVAAFADRHLGANGRLAVAAPAVPPSSIDDYVRKVEAGGGDVERARATARDLSRLPPDAVRVAAHLARPAGTVVPAGEPAALLVVFDPDEAPAASAEASFEAGGRRAIIYYDTAQ